MHPHDTSRLHSSPLNPRPHEPMKWLHMDVYQVLQESCPPRRLLCGPVLRLQTLEMPCLLSSSNPCQHPINRSTFKIAAEFSHVPYLCCHRHLDPARCGLSEGQVSDGLARPGGMGTDGREAQCPRESRRKPGREGTSRATALLPLPLPPPSAPHFCSRGGQGCPQEAAAIWPPSPQAWPPFLSCVCTGRGSHVGDYTPSCRLSAYGSPSPTPARHSPPAPTAEVIFQTLLSYVCLLRVTLSGTGAGVLTPAGQSHFRHLSFASLRPSWPPGWVFLDSSPPLGLCPGCSTCLESSSQRGTQLTPLPPVSLCPVSSCERGLSGPQVIPVLPLAQPGAPRPFPLLHLLFS